MTGPRYMMDLLGQGGAHYGPGGDFSELGYGTDWGGPESFPNFRGGTPTMRLGMPGETRVLPRSGGATMRLAMDSATRELPRTGGNTMRLSMPGESGNTMRLGLPGELSGTGRLGMPGETVGTGRLAIMPELPDVGGPLSNQPTPFDTVTGAAAGQGGMMSNLARGVREGWPGLVTAAGLQALLNGVDAANRGLPLTPAERLFASLPIPGNPSFSLAGESATPPPPHTVAGMMATSLPGERMPSHGVGMPRVDASTVRAVADYARQALHAINNDPKLQGSFQGGLGYRRAIEGLTDHLMRATGWSKPDIAKLYLGITGGKFGATNSALPPSPGGWPASPDMGV